MRLGKLTELIAAAPRSLPVVFDSDLPPGDLASYRGYYSNLAIEPAGEVPVTVAEFGAKLRAAHGATFKGYKGGDFEMDADTPVWAATYGHASSIGIIGVDVLEDRVVIRTADVDGYGGW